VSRGGRPYLAGEDYLKFVRAPTLLIVEGNDDKQIIDLNKESLDKLKNIKK
jgi:hypothetical protein